MKCITGVDFDGKVLGWVKGGSLPLRAILIACDLPKNPVPTGQCNISGTLTNILLVGVGWCKKCEKSNLWIYLSISGLDKKFSFSKIHFRFTSAMMKIKRK